MSHLIMILVASFLFIGCGLSKESKNYAKRAQNYHEQTLINYDKRLKAYNSFKLSKEYAMFKRYDDKTSFGFMIFDPRFEIQQGGDFDTAELDRDRNLHLYASIQPRPVL